MSARFYDDGGDVDEFLDGVEAGAAWCQRRARRLLRKGRRLTKAELAELAELHGGKQALDRELARVVPED